VGDVRLAGELLGGHIQVAKWEDRVNGHRFLPMYGHRFSPPAAIFSPHWRPWVLPMTWGSRFRRSGGRRP
jgi:hypothetical protein